jgi:VanZ family protein
VFFDFWNTAAARVTSNLLKIKIIIPSVSEWANRGLRIAGILFCLLLVVFAKFHEPTRFVHNLQKLAHPVTFGAVALLFLTLLRPRTPRLSGHYIAAFVLTVLCGAGTEIAQAFVDRDPSFLDVLRDALGATTALAAFATLTQPQKASRWSGRRVLGATLTIVGFVVMVTPVSISLAAYARRDRASLCYSRRARRSIAISCKTEVPRQP